MDVSKAKRAFTDLDYPTTTRDIVEEIGETELELPIGTETVGEVFGRLGEETYADASEAYTMFQSGLSSKAIGRKWYSDRDPPTGSSGDPLLQAETRHDCAGPHCGICHHVSLVGDWDVVAYCESREEIVQPEVDDVCEDFERVQRPEAKQDA